MDDSHLETLLKFGGPENFDLPPSKEFSIHQGFIKLHLCARHFQVLLDPKSSLGALDESSWVSMSWDNQ